MIQIIPSCPTCGNILSIDGHTSSKYCKSRTCNGKVFEQGTITYEQEVNLHETDDHTKKQTRFGGYESKTDAFKDRLLEKLGKSDKKDRKKLYEKFSDGEELIYYLSSCFRTQEAITKDVLIKYRTLLFENIDKLNNKSFRVVGAIAYDLTLMEKKKVIKDDRILNKIDSEVIREFAKLTSQQIEQVTHELKIQNQKNPNDQLVEQIVLHSKHMGFSVEEQRALKEIPNSLIQSNLIKGEKPNTIRSVVIYLVAQLSRSPHLNTLSIDQITQDNLVTKDTVKKLWNSIIQSNLTDQQIPFWPDRKALSELRPIQ